MHSSRLPIGVKSLLLFISMLTIAACTRTPAASGTKQVLLVTLPETRTIAAFAANASGDAQPLGTIRETAPDVPVDARATANADIFVANANANIKVFAGDHGKYYLVRSIAGPHTLLANPVGMATDAGGDIFLADRGSKAGDARVMWFAAALTGNILPGRVITGPHTGLTSPAGIAIDASEESFVADHDSGKVLVFASDANGDAAPVVTISGLKGPDHVFVDSDLNIYVTCRGDNSIAVFVPDGPEVWSPNYRLTGSALHDPSGVAVDSTGKIAVGMPGAILFFAADARGAATPATELQGPWPMNPASLAIR